MLSRCLLRSCSWPASRGPKGSLPRFTPGGWSAFVFIGVSSGVGYFLWLWALKHTTPTKVAVFLSLSPVTATILGALILSEPVTATFLFGLAAVAFGLIVAHREKS